MLQKLSLSSSQLLIWSFIPYRMKEQNLISEYYDNATYRQELKDVFAELGLAWKWQPITLENMEAVVEEVASADRELIPIVLNYCDGYDEIDGYPSTGAVAKLLQAKGIIFTGADAATAYLCDNKILTKQALIQADVATPAYEVISDITCIQGIVNRLGTPLIVKPAKSYASHGISLKSVVYNDEQAIAQVERLVQGQHNRKFTLDSIFIEQFINGPEFTVFLLGSAQQPDRIKIYPPVERVLHSSLPDNERFLSFERFWRKYKEETLPSAEEPFYRFQSAADNLDQQLRDLSQRAYCAVGGNGYARVDIRMDKATQQLFVLEINVNCGISNSHENETSVTNILVLSGITFAELMAEIIAEALTFHSQL
jgi:D-alanine-D-alanine ligase